MLTGCIEILAAIASFLGKIGEVAGAASEAVSSVSNFVETTGAVFEGDPNKNAEVLNQNQDNPYAAPQAAISGANAGEQQENSGGTENGSQEETKAKSQEDLFKEMEKWLRENGWSEEEIEAKMSSLKNPPEQITGEEPIAAFIDSASAAVPVLELLKPTAFGLQSNILAAADVLGNMESALGIQE
jgi:hypothetical protein